MVFLQCVWVRVITVATEGACTEVVDAMHRLATDTGGRIIEQARLQDPSTQGLGVAIRERVRSLMPEFWSTCCEDLDRDGSAQPQVFCAVDPTAAAPGDPLLDGEATRDPTSHERVGVNDDKSLGRTALAHGFSVRPLASHDPPITLAGMCPFLSASGPGPLGLGPCEKWSRRSHWGHGR